MSKQSPHDDLFEQALRAGPRRVEPSVGFEQRMENSWRHAPVRNATDWAVWWRGVLSDLTGPAVALAALALVVVFVQEAPQIDPVTTSPEIAAQASVFDPADVFRGGALANLRSSLDGAYEEESRLMLEDTARALRFAASQFLSPEMIARVDERAWIAADRSRDG